MKDNQTVLPRAPVGCSVLGDKGLGPYNVRDQSQWIADRNLLGYVLVRGLDQNECHSPLWSTLYNMCVGEIFLYEVDHNGEGPSFWSRPCTRLK